MYQKRYGYVLTGLSELIMHWDNIEWMDGIDVKRTQIKEKDKANFKAGDDRCPPETWKGYTYNDGEHVCVPTDNLRSCLMKASARITLSKQKSFKELSQAGITFDNIYLKLECSGKTIPWAPIEAIKGKYIDHVEAVKKMDFRLLAKRARVNQTKHVRVRPVFNEWTVAGTLLVVDEQITDEVIERMFTIAGLDVGLCDWRPGSPKSPGPYGRFRSDVKAA